MEVGSDFIEWLGPDIAIRILMCLENPSDLVRVSSVSSSWRQFVIENAFAKQLCLRMYPELSRVAHVFEANNMIQPLKSLERDHRGYALLARGLTSFMRKDCISKAISASSTDNYPEESIQNTLVPSDMVQRRASYWSSKGESDPRVPETLAYELIANLCVIDEVSVKPFQAYFQFGYPIYSAKAVRFRFGHPKSLMKVHIENRDGSANEKFVWTYTSPEFPMTQENSLQTFKLPEPVICIGGILQIELLGRVQKQELDGLYYICVSHVQVVGRPLSPVFDVEILNASGECDLMYHPEAEYCVSPKSESGPSRIRHITARLMQRGMRGWEQMILNTLLGAGAAIVDEIDASDDDEILAAIDDDDDDDDSDDDELVAA